MATGAVFTPKSKKIAYNRKCSVKGCNSCPVQDRNVVFHRFPAENATRILMPTPAGLVFKDRLIVWLEKCGIKSKNDLVTSSFVCSRHFSFDDYSKSGYANQKKTQQKLKSTAYPTLNLPASADLGTSPTERVTVHSNTAGNSQPVATRQEDCEVPKRAATTANTHSSPRAVTPKRPRDVDDAILTEPIIRPPDMLCAIYSLPVANPAELDAQDSDMSSESCDSNTQNSDTTEDMSGFYSRCLLCTCRPVVTPHLKIFSDTGNELQLAEKLNKYLNIQIEPGLPQRVCRNCLEKLEVANELAVCSKRARILLLQIKQQGDDFGTANLMDHDNNQNQSALADFEHIDIAPEQHFRIKMEPLDSSDLNYSEQEPELESNQLATDSLTRNKKDSIDTRSKAMDQKESDFPMEQENNSVEGFYLPVNEEPTRITISEFIGSAEVETPGLFGCIGDDDVANEDFIKCSQCSQTLFKGHMDYHMRAHNGQVEPSEVVGKTIQRRRDSAQDVILDVRYCKFCKLNFSSQVMDLHVSLRHTHKTYQKKPKLQEEPDLLQCPTCYCVLSPEMMQEHITKEHPPKHNPVLEERDSCCYCGKRIRYCDLEQHLKLQHGSNAWRKCIHCQKQVRNSDTDIEAHLYQYHRGGKLLACIKCDERYAKTGQEQAHMQIFLSCKYKCPLLNCKETFVTSSSFKDHVLSCHPKIEEEMQGEHKREIYGILGLDPETGAILEEPKVNKKAKITPPSSPHTKYDYGGRVKCDICNIFLNHKYCLIKHKNKVHNANLSFDCVDCGKKYSNMNNILKHLQFVHAVKDQKCDICGEAFTKLGYRNHMKWHQQQQQYGPRNYFYRPLDPVRCGMCNRPARNKYALLTHINAEHLDVVKERLTFHCEQCDREFANYEYLMQHNYSKHLPKIVCTYCGKLITQNRMSMHLKLHEPDRGSNYKGKKRGRKPKQSNEIPC